MWKGNVHMHLFVLKVNLYIITLYLKMSGLCVRNITSKFNQSDIVCDKETIARWSSALTYAKYSRDKINVTMVMH